MTLSLTLERLYLLEVNSDATDHGRLGGEGRLGMVCALLLDLLAGYLLGLVHLVGHIDWLGSLRLDDLQARIWVRCEGLIFTYDVGGHLLG